MNLIYISTVRTDTDHRTTSRHAFLYTVMRHVLIHSITIAFFFLELIRVSIFLSHFHMIFFFLLCQRAFFLPNSFFLKKCIVLFYDCLGLSHIAGGFGQFLFLKEMPLFAAISMVEAICVLLFFHFHFTLLFLLNLYLQVCIMCITNECTRWEWTWKWEASQELWLPASWHWSFELVKTNQRKKNKKFI